MSANGWCSTAEVLSHEPRIRPSANHVRLSRCSPEQGWHIRCESIGESNAQLRSGRGLGRASSLGVRGNETTTSELLGRHLPKSKIVKAFNAIQAAQIESNGRPKGSPDRRALPIASDDPAAKKIVADLLDQFGFDVVDAGPLAKGWRFQKDTPAYCVPLDSAKLGEALSAAS
jgi:hypothetical protein